MEGSAAVALAGENVVDVMEGEPVERKTVVRTMLEVVDGNAEVVLEES